jgi:hypothetical protein
MAGAAALSLALAMAIDQGVIILAEAWPPLAAGLMGLGSWSIFLILAIGLGLGALAVHCAERLFPQVRLNGGSLWTLVACVGGELGLLSLLPLPVLLISFSEPMVMAILVGVFWRGRAHWQRF